MGFYTFVLFGCVLGSLSIVCDATSRQEKRVSGQERFPSEHFQRFLNATLPANVSECVLPNASLPVPACLDSGYACGFQFYDDDATKVPIGDLVKYCDCPEDETCRMYSIKYSQNCFRYRCMDADTWRQTRDGWILNPTPDYQVLSRVNRPNVTEVSDETSDIQERIGLLHYPHEL